MWLAYVDGVIGLQEAYLYGYTGWSVVLVLPLSTWHIGSVSGHLPRVRFHIPLTKKRFQPPTASRSMLRTDEISCHSAITRGSSLFPPA